MILNNYLILIPFCTQQSFSPVHLRGQLQAISSSISSGAALTSNIWCTYILPQTPIRAQQVKKLTFAPDDNFFIFDT